MAQEGKITQQDVDLICAKLQAKGQQPTTRLIRLEHGAGSTSTIQRMLAVWQGENPRTEVPLVLSEAVQKALANQLALEAAKAKEQAVAELVAAKETIHDLTKEAEQLDESNARLRAELDGLHDSETALKGQIQQMQTDLASAHEELARVRAEAEQARQARAVAELRAESVPKMETALAELRATLTAEQQGRVQAEQAHAVSETKCDGLTTRLAETQLRGEQAQAQLHAALEQIDKLQKSSTHDAVRVEAAHARLEAAEARMTNAEKRADRYKDEAKEANAKASELAGECRTLQAALEQARKSTQQSSDKAKE